MSKVKKKKKEFKMKKELVIAVVFILVLILGVVFLLSKKGDTSEEGKENTPKTEEKGEVFTEKDLEESYGMSSSRAIEIVKELYNSDNFEFVATVNNNAKYLVTVTNSITGAKTVYEVDPVTESFYEIK